MSSDNKEKRKNNLNTKVLPPVFMLIGGLVAFIVCTVFEYETKTFLVVMFCSFFIFAVLGTIVKCIVDSFNMELDYEDVLAMEEGAVRDKGNTD